MSYILAVAGGSGSGKTTFIKRLCESLDKSQFCIIAQDSYYLDQSEHFDKDGGNVNFDHPESLEFGLLLKHLNDLNKGKPVDVPIYDYATHKRLKESIYIKPVPLILVDGTLLLSQNSLIELFDYSIFIDAPEKLRYERRLKRDVLERGRTQEGVHSQFIAQVKPMHDLFIEPSKVKANTVVTVEDFDQKLNSLLIKVKEILREKQ